MKEQGIESTWMSRIQNKYDLSIYLDSLKSGCRGDLDPLFCDLSMRRL
jgi:hypothetical protein